MTPTIDHLLSEIRSVPVACRVGRVSSVEGGTLRATGLSDVATLGDIVRIGGRGGTAGEVISIAPDEVTILAEGGDAGQRLGSRVFLEGALRLAPDEGWIGRVIDPYGVPLDGRPLPGGGTPRPIRAAPPEAMRRRGFGPRLEAGSRLFNTMLPIVRGQRLGLFAGPGVGKTTLLARLSTRIDADVVVVALAGERGREVREFVARALGEAGMRRAVVVAATSDRSALARRQCLPAAMTVAEHFRDSGRNVLLVADSVSRFAEAHREIALAAGEAPTLGGYPPSLVSAVTALCERAGPGGPGQGDITALFSVLVAGSDMDGPVADTLRGVLDGHVVLDRAIAERGRFPAVDVLKSVSRSLPDAASDAENAVIAEARRLLGTFERAELMIQSGLYMAGSDAEIDRAIAVWPALDAFFAQAEPATSAESFAALARSLAVAPPADSPGAERESEQAGPG